MKFNFEIKIKKGKDKRRKYYISNIKGTPFISQGKSKNECVQNTFDMIAGFIEAFPITHKKSLKKYGILK